MPTRWVAEQVASALTYLHGFQLVHGSVTPENILIFRPNLSLVKITDFGSTCRGGTFVRRRLFNGPYTPPELSREGAEGYYTGTSLDSWALGVIIIHCLTGNKPWSTSDISDPEYAAFRNWQRVKSIRVPRPFKRFTVRLLRLLRRLLEPRGWSRYPAKEVFKYLEDDWMIKSRDRSDSHDYSSSLVSLPNPKPHPPSSEETKDPQQPQQDHEPQDQLMQGRVSSPRRFLAELLRFSSPNSSIRHRRKNHAWHQSSSSSSSSSSFSWLNSSSSNSSFSTSTNYSSV